MAREFTPRPRRNRQQSNRQQSNPATRRNQFSAWLNHHHQLLRETAYDLRQDLTASVLTTLVLAIALIFPALLYLAQKNLQQITAVWQDGAQVTLYLQPTTNTEAGQALRDNLAKRPEVRAARFYSQSDATEELGSWLGISQVLASLEHNPLPASIVITPIAQTRTEMELLELVFRELPEVADIQLDIEWVQRLEQINQLLNRLLWVLILVLSLMVLLVVGNTMRMAASARRSEIQVIKLVGATQAYIRRPFLYLGFSYGLMGSVLASLGLILTFSLLRGPANTLVGSYGGGGQLLFFSFFEWGVLINLGILLSMLSTWLTVMQALRRIEPEPI